MGVDLLVDIGALQASAFRGKVHLILKLLPQLSFPLLFLLVSSQATQWRPQSLEDLYLQLTFPLISPHFPLANLPQRPGSLVLLLQFVAMFYWLLVFARSPLQAPGRAHQIPKITRFVKLHVVKKR